MNRKNFIIRKRHFLIAMSAMAAMHLTGCGRIDLLQDTITVEAGASLSENLDDYAKFSSEKLKEGAALVLDGVDTEKTGTYQAAISANGKEYAFSVEVVDTTAPEVELKETQVLVNSASAIHVDDFIDSVEDISECYMGFRNPVMELTDEQVQEDFLASKNALEGEDLEAAEQELDENYEELESWTETVENPEELSGSLELDTDGQYLVELVVADASGNANIFEVVVFLDTTPPTVEGVEPVTVSFNNMMTDEAILQNVQVTDNMFGDLKPNVLLESMDGDLQNLTLSYSVEDYAGNQSEFCIDVTVAGAPSLEDLAALATGDRSETAHPGSQEVITESSKSGFDRSKAEEAFALVNQQRLNNGLPAMEWDESLYELACVRAQEIVQNFSHDSSSGVNAEYAENIAQNYRSSIKVVNAWMNSAGHRANILDTRSARGAIACFNNYWVNLFSL